MRLETVFRLEVFAILVQLVLIVILLFLNLKALKIRVAGVRKKIWISLFLILILGTCLRLGYAHTHTEDILGDEMLHIELAKNIKQIFQKNPCYFNEVYTKYIPAHSAFGECDFMQVYPVTFSFFIFISSFLFSSFEWAGIFVSFMLGLLSIILMFFLAYFLFKDETIALFSALLFSFFPFFVEFSLVPTNFMTSIFLITLSAIFVVLAIDLGTWKMWLLAGLALILMAFTRDENMILLFVFAIFILIQKINKKKFLLCFFGSSVFYVPYVLYLINPLVIAPVNTDIFWVYNLKILFVKNLLYNTYFNLKYVAYPLSWLFGLAGFFCLFRKNRSSFYLLSSWFLIIFLFYGAYNAAMGAYQLDRFIFSYIPFIIISAAGMHYFFQKITFLVRKAYRPTLAVLFLILILALNINFLIHYPGRSGFIQEYSYLKPANSYPNTQFITYNETHRIGYNLVWGVGWEKMNLFISREEIIFQEK